MSSDGGAVQVPEGREARAGTLVKDGSLEQQEQEEQGHGEEP